MQQLPLPPGELLDKSGAGIAHPLVEAEWHEEASIRKEAHEVRDGGVVEMVVVVVADVLIILLNIAILIRKIKRYCPYQRR